MAHGKQTELERDEFQIIGTKPMLIKATAQQLKIHIFKTNQSSKFFNAKH